MPRNATWPQRRRSAVIIGSSAVGIDVAKAIREMPSPYWVRGFVDGDGDGDAVIQEGFEVLCGYEELADLMRRETIHSLIVVPPRDLKDDAVLEICRLGSRGAQIIPASTLYERLVGKIPMDAINDGRFLMVTGELDRAGWYRVTKRAVDVAMSTAALMIFAFSLPIVTLGIKMGSPGPVFFRQKRAGMGGKNFTVYKLRTMVNDAEEGGPAWACSHDGRVTCFGRFLRRLRLDEVPQFWNVLKGDMSVVGPRPERPFFVRKLRALTPYYVWRHRVKPGITGWAQIHQGYAATNEESLEKLQYDLYYLKNRSLLLDVVIILRTALVVLRRKGVH